MKFYQKYFSLCFFIILMIAGNIAFCNASTDDSSTVLTIRIDNYEGKVLKFSYQDYSPLSSLHNIDTTVNDDGTFKFILPIDMPIRGFFSCGKVPAVEKFSIRKPNGEDSAVSQSTFDFRLVYVYMQPGDELNVLVDANNISKSLVFQGDHVNDNIFMNKEDEIFNAYKEKVLNNYYTYVTYAPNQYLNYVDQLKARKLKFLREFNKKQKLSKHLFKVFTWDFYGRAVSSKLNYPSVREQYLKEKVTLPPDYFDFLNKVKTAKRSADLGVSYYFFLDSYLRAVYKRKQGQIDFYDFVKNQLDGRALYDYYAFSLRRDFTRKLYSKFDANSPFPQLAQKVRLKYHHMEGILEGSPAPKVSFLNPEGETEQLYDYKGKYIYIDCWATWCGPCIKEIPSLKVLEKEYHGKNITFISISFDDEEANDKWEKFIDEHQLTGVQVRIDSANKAVFTKSFNIQQIPRFIILDKEGKIVDANAPRPSDDNIRKVLSRLEGI